MFFSPGGHESFPPFSIMTCAKTKSRLPPLQRFYISSNKTAADDDAAVWLAGSATSSGPDIRKQRV